jgi:hypothetical protein
MTLKTFMPNGSATATISATTVTARAAVDQHSNSARVVNAGTATAFLKFGDSTVEATTTDMPILSGATETFTKGAATHIAAITASGTATVYLTSGEGL